MPDAERASASTREPSVSLVRDSLRAAVEGRCEIEVASRMAIDFMAVWFSCSMRDSAGAGTWRLELVQWPFLPGGGGRSAPLPGAFAPVGWSCHSLLRGCP